MIANFSSYADNDTLAELLKSYGHRHPGLCRIGEIGQSYEKRPIWLATITNFGTGEPEDKPAHWMDGNLHASEVTGTMACLHTIETLLSGYDSDPAIRRLLDESVLYFAPRLNPDGADRAFHSPPHRIRSGVRPYPYPEPRDGLHEEDIDGDGRILTMRLQDPAGDWKVSESDPRLMVKRGLDEYGGQYFRLLPEGRVKNYQPGIITVARRVEGLDFNRNFPFEWAPEGEQIGAGPFPTSEPETRAAVDFIVSHPNINGVTTCHTTGGVLLRSYSTKPDEKLTPEDLWVFQRLGRRGTELTGYPNVSTYHEFMYHPRHLTFGAFDDWCFDHLGIFAWTVEIWDLLSQAGIKDRKFIEWYRDHPVEDDLKILRWADEHVGPEAFVPWYSFEHPQIGLVELGGWNSLFLWSNPPHVYLEAELKKVTAFTVAHANTHARVNIKSLSVKAIADGVSSIEVIIENTGYMPTYTSKRAQERGALKPITVNLTLPEECALVDGKAETEIGQLEGRSNKLNVGGLGFSPTDNCKRIGWVVSHNGRGSVEVVVRSERGGTARETVNLS
jgi:murein tripeptide amidase MpaA